MTTTVAASTFVSGGFWDWTFLLVSLITLTGFMWRVFRLGYIPDVFHPLRRGTRRQQVLGIATFVLISGLYIVALVRM